MGNWGTFNLQLTYHLQQCVSDENNDTLSGGKGNDTYDGKGNDRLVRW